MDRTTALLNRCLRLMLRATPHPDDRDQWQDTLREAAIDLDRAADRDGAARVILDLWRGCLWLGSLSQRPTAVLAKTEQAAKKALLAEAREWLRKAGVE